MPIKRESCAYLLILQVSAPRLKWLFFAYSELYTLFLSYFEKIAHMSVV